MTLVQEKTIKPPRIITQSLHGGWAAQALKAAVEIDVFSPIQAGVRTPGAIAQKCQADARGVKVLLDALVGLECLTKKDDSYLLTYISEIYLLPESPLYMGEFIKIHADLYKAWLQLTDAVKSGKPVVSVNDDEEAQKFFPALARAIFPMSYSTARQVAKTLKIADLPAGTRVLDIACGSGVWTIAMAQANNKLKVDGLDYASVLKVMEECTARFKVGEQFRGLAGAWADVEMENKAYDLVVLGHILHSEGREQSEKLLSACYEALKPGGKIVIAEFFTNDDHSAPADALLFGLHMYLVTNKGCVFSEKEVGQMLRAAGFSDAQRLELEHWGSESPVMVARK